MLLNNVSVYYLNNYYSSYTLELFYLKFALMITAKNRKYKFQISLIRRYLKFIFYYKKHPSQ